MVPHDAYGEQEIKVIIDSVQNLETNIRELHRDLELTLSAMDTLRHKATAFQRSLLQVKKNDDKEIDRTIQELGRIMRGFQEQGRLFETVAEPLQLTGPDIVVKLGRSANDLTTIMNRQNEDSG
jgi:predicted RNase H-like nuclease (RuvC/YqgF family)